MWKAAAWSRTEAEWLWTARAVYPADFSAEAMDSQTASSSSSTVWKGYSPAPKKVRSMPVSTSNSVLAVPAPRVLTPKKPEG